MLHKIAEYSAISMMDDGQFWMEGLLNIALVAKSWSLMVDDFFKIHTSMSCSQKPRLSSVAASLRCRPAKGRLMKGLSLWNYTSPLQQTPSITSAFHRDLVAITQATTRVKVVEIYPIDPSLYQDYISALTRLEKLETCVVSTFFMNWQIEGHLATLDDVQKVMSHWPALSSLQYTGLDSERYSGRNVERYRS